jgi:uncharacterized membrane protein
MAQCLRPRDLDLYAGLAAARLPPIMIGNLAQRREKGGTGMTLSQNDQTQPIVSDTSLALAVYVLYCASYIFGITVIIGLIIAYVKVGDADPMLKTHYQFQIRTFWIGLLYFVVGVVLTFVLIGIVILLWWFVWSLVRIIKGLLALNERKPIANPTSWMFG